MPGIMVQGELVGIVEGPAMVLNIRGVERKIQLGVQVPLTWVSQHMEQQVTVLVENGKIVELM